MKEYSRVDIHRKLRGAISFYGESNHDEKSLKALEEEGSVLYELVHDIAELYDETRKRCEWSGISLAKKAKEVLNSIKTLIEDYLSEEKENDK